MNQEEYLEEKRKRKDSKRKEAIIRSMKHWGNYNKMPNNVKFILQRTYMKLGIKSRLEIRKRFNSINEVIFY